MTNFLIFLGIVLFIWILYYHHRRLSARMYKESIPEGKTFWQRLLKGFVGYIIVTVILLAFVFALQFLP